MINFCIYFIDFLLKRKCHKTQNNRKFKQKIVEKSIKIFTILVLSVNSFTAVGFVTAIVALVLLIAQECFFNALLATFAHKLVRFA